MPSKPDSSASSPRPTPTGHVPSITASWGSRWSRTAATRSCSTPTARSCACSACRPSRRIPTPRSAGRWRRRRQARALAASGVAMARFPGLPLDADGVWTPPTARASPGSTTRTATRCRCPSPRGLIDRAIVGFHLDDMTTGWPSSPAATSSTCAMTRPGRTAPGRRRPRAAPARWASCSPAASATRARRRTDLSDRVAWEPRERPARRRSPL